MHKRIYTLTHYIHLFFFLLTGTLQSYRGRFQEDYVMGSVFQEPAKTAEPVREAEPLDPDSLLLRPADEDDTQVWSTSTTSDLLF